MKLVGSGTKTPTFVTSHLKGRTLDPLHATLEEFAADGYTHVEANCRAAAISFRKSRWGLRLTGWRAGCATLNAEARCCWLSRGGKQMRAAGLGNGGDSVGFGRRLPPCRNLMPRVSSPAQLQNQQSYPDNYSKQREAENGQEVSPHAAFITSE